MGVKVKEEEEEEEEEFRIVHMQARFITRWDQHTVAQRRL